MSRSLFKPGENCWRLGRSDGAAVLIDAASYFESLFVNFQKAQRSIMILGWDIDSRQALVPVADGAGERDGVPVRLGALLDRLARDRPELTVHVLSWDYAPLFALGREAFQRLKLDWQTHERVHFRYDAEHPVSASHHQKVVVIDDEIAYSGGLDLTGSRWDTTAHDPGDARRRTPDGAPYAPFHDVQIAVTGAPARWLGELCRERWRLATGETLPAPTEAPPRARRRREARAASRFVLPDDRFDAPVVALARTTPAYKTTREVREVERLFLDMIARAERYIYIENQYFTADVVVDALKTKLRRARGPEIVIVLPKRQDNWLSQRTMGTLSDAAVAEVRAADRHKRLHILYPEDKRLDAGLYVNVHAKVMAVDDQYLRIGSANLNNRSMGLDTEMDVVVDATADEAARARIREIVAHLIGHHVGVDPVFVVSEWERTRGLCKTVGALPKDGPKSLDDYKCTSSVGSTLLAELEVTDPERPIGLDRLIDDLAFRRSRARGAAPPRLWLLPYWTTMVAAAALALVALRVPELTRAPDGAAWPWWQILAGFVALGAAGVPVNLLTCIVAVCLTGPRAFGVAVLAGAVVAALGYLVGFVASPRLIHRRSLYFLRQPMLRESVAGVALVRLFPIGPYVMVSAAAGHARLPLAVYCAGSLLAGVPAAAAVVALQNAVVKLASRPTPLAAVQAIVTASLLSLACYLVSRRLVSPDAAEAAPERSFLRTPVAAGDG
jgi:phosphatidylserine/phosphatidylglycerophosphate/cardiolipin synthase-like enzyme/uncharacterized membrane protein YdjX (TVP38/TMEM64 family)